VRLPCVATEAPDKSTKLSFYFLDPADGVNILYPGILDRLDRTCGETSGCDGEFLALYHALRELESD